MSRVPEAFQGKSSLGRGGGERRAAVPLDGPGSYTNEERDGALCADVGDDGGGEARRVSLCGVMGCAVHGPR